MLIGAEGGGPGPKCGVAAFIEVEVGNPCPTKSSASIVRISIGVLDIGGYKKVVASVGVKDGVACPGPNCDGNVVVTLSGGGPGPYSGENDAASFVEVEVGIPSPSSDSDGSNAIASIGVDVVALPLGEVALARRRSFSLSISRARRKVAVRRSSAVALSSPALLMGIRPHSRSMSEALT